MGGKFKDELVSGSMYLNEKKPLRKSSSPYLEGVNRRLWVDVEFRQVETGHEYVNRLAMTNEKAWMKVSRKAKGC